MKKNYYLYIVIAFALVAVLPLAARAEDTTADVTVEASASVDAEVRPGTKPIVRPGTPIPANLREQLRIKAENLKTTEEARKRLLQTNKPASTTRPLIKDLRGDVRMMASTTRAERKDISDDRREEVKGIRQEGRQDIRNASGTMERREIRKDMHRDIFKARQEAVIKQLTVSLNNLRQIRERINSRIEKATSAGKDMTKAKSLLITADAKIAAAITTVDTLKVYTPVTTTASTEDQTSIDLVKPRQLAEAAIKAIKEAHTALVTVVRAIAHGMGTGANATTTINAEVITN